VNILKIYSKTCMHTILI